MYGENKGSPALMNREVAEPNYDQTVHKIVQALEPFSASEKSQLLKDAKNYYRTRWEEELHECKAKEESLKKQLDSISN